MIALALRNFRGCARADLGLDPIALVAGRNAAGKSSIAQATAAALVGNGLPLGMTKAAAGLLVMAGASAAVVELRGDKGKTRIDWPAGVVAGEGEAPQASIWAAGLDSVATLPAKDRARTLGSYLGAAPTRADLAQALDDVELGHDQVVTTIWLLIEDQGWDGAHTMRKERGAQYKGEWRQVAGVNYGSRVAASWRPAGWSDFEAPNENDLLAAVVRAKAEHERAIGRAAVSGAERRQLEQQAGEIDDLRRELEQAEETARVTAEAAHMARVARETLPPADTTAGVMPCPHCGEPVIFRQVSLVERHLEKAPPAPSADELKRRQLAIAAADGERSRLAGDVIITERAAEAVRQKVHTALAAGTRLAGLPPAGGKSEDVEAARRAVEAAEGRLNAWRQKVKADDLREKIANNDRLLDVLAPEGLRGTKLARVLDTFNGELAALATAAGWQAPAFDAEMTVSYGGRPYALLSTSEQYRVRAVLQVAMARRDGSAMVVVDAADVLDAPTRSGLFAMLAAAEIGALVCMTLSRRDQVPDLAAAGLGASYWIEGGVAAVLPAPAEAA